MRAKVHQVQALSLFFLLFYNRWAGGQPGGKILGRTEKILNDMQAWDRSPFKASLKVTKDMFSHEHREAWVELLIMRNKTIPSFAAVVQHVLSCAESQEVVDASWPKTSKTLHFLKGARASYSNM